MRPALEVEGEQGHEDPADAVSVDAEGVPDTTQFSSRGALPAVEHDEHEPEPTASERAFGVHAHGGHEEGKHYREAADTKQDTKQDSHRFGGDKDLEAIAGGLKTVKKGDQGYAVVKLQQALIDLGYEVPYGVDGIFGDGGAQLMLPVNASGGGYAGTFTVAMRPGEAPPAGPGRGGPGGRGRGRGV